MAARQLSPRLNTRGVTWVTISQARSIARSSEDPRVAPLSQGDPGKQDLRGMRIGFVDDDEYLPPAEDHHVLVLAMHCTLDDLPRILA